MNKFERGDEITLDDNTKYAVVDSFMLNNKHYLYLISVEDQKNTMIVECEGDDVIEIEDKAELDSLYSVLIERNKSEINKYLEEMNEN